MIPVGVLRIAAAPSYEQLAALVVAQERMIAQLQARVAVQDAEIAELRRQLAASSRNPSKSPSSDALGKPALKSLRGPPENGTVALRPVEPLVKCGT